MKIVPRGNPVPKYNPLNDQNTLSHAIAVLKKHGVHDLMYLESQRTKQSRDITEALNVTQKQSYRASTLPFIPELPKYITNWLAEIILCARYQRHIVVRGATGTGKDRMAHVLHDLSNRSKKPFVPINCVEFSETILESEIFGHTTGAFTGATTSRKGLICQADGGTLFLDELGKSSVHFQAKLLRVIETGMIRPIGSDKTAKAGDIYVIAALQPNDIIIPDLQHRLGYSLEIMTLNDRLREIDNPLVILNNSLKKVLKEMDMPSDLFNLSKKSIDLLAKKEYPGNYRELESILRRAIFSAIKRNRPQIAPDDLLNSDPTHVRIAINCSSHYKEIPLKDIVQMADEKAAELRHAMIVGKVQDVQSSNHKVKAVILREGGNDSDYHKLRNEFKRLTGVGFKKYKPPKEL